MLACQSFISICNVVLKEGFEKTTLQEVMLIFYRGDDTAATEISKLKSKCDMILDGLDQEKADKAKLTELSTAFGTLFDKIRLLKGESTEIIDINQVNNEIKELELKIRLEAEHKVRLELEGKNKSEKVAND